MHGMKWAETTAEKSSHAACCAFWVTHWLKANLDGARKHIWTVYHPLVPCPDCAHMLVRCRDTCSCAVVTTAAEAR